MKDIVSISIVVSLLYSVACSAALILSCIYFRSYIVGSVISYPPSHSLLSSMQLD